MPACVQLPVFCVSDLEPFLRFMSSGNAGVLAFASWLLSFSGSFSDVVLSVVEAREAQQGMSQALVTLTMFSKLV